MTVGEKMGGGGAPSKGDDSPGQSIEGQSVGGGGFLENIFASGARKGMGGAYYRRKSRGGIAGRDADSLDNKENREMLHVSPEKQKKKLTIGLLKGKEKPAQDITNQTTHRKHKKTIETSDCQETTPSIKKK